MSRKHARFVLAIGLAGATALQGCAGGPGSLFNNENLGQEQQSLRDGADNLADAAEEIEACSGGERVAAAIILGMLGALAGASVADDDHRLEGMLIGAGAGAAAGYAAGSYVGAKNCQYATAQEALQKRIVEARAETRQYKKMVSEAKTVVAQHREKIARLNDDYQKNLITTEAYKEQIAGLSGDVAALRSLIDSNVKTVASFEEEINSLSMNNVDTEKLKSQRDLLVAERHNLEAELETLVAAVASIPPEVRPASV